MQFSWQVFAIKITSRKLWVAVAGLATSIMAYLNCDGNTIVQVTAIITALGSVIGYLVANGLTDDAAGTAESTTETAAGSEQATTGTDTAAAEEPAAAVGETEAGAGETGNPADSPEAETGLEGTVSSQPASK